MLTGQMVGNLGRDPEMKYFESGTAVAKCSIAVETGYDRDSKQKITEWVKLEFWGKQAETIANYCRKGSKIMVSGELSIERWNSREGEAKQVIVCKVSSFQLLGGREQSEENSNSGDRTPVAAAAPTKTAQQSAKTEQAIDYDDIPF